MELLTFFLFATQAYAGLLPGPKGSRASASCRCFPGDSCWPAASAWASLNSTVGGRLIATVPIGSPCHDPNYSDADCAALQSAWQLPQTHLASSSSVMQAFFANQSCDPFTAQSSQCLLGNYARYTVNATSSADVVAAINFARTKNIRFVIRNTGHDYKGASTGAGSLSIWTQHLKTAQFLDWSDSSYNGKAFKMGAGILGYEAVTLAAAQGLVVLSGTCPTVGAAGGYLQGGGHSALSTNFGLAADQVLEWEVATAAGKIVKASRTTNPDLYWALSGGGGGTYAVVLSATVRAYTDAKVGGAQLQMAAAYTTPDKFYEAIARFHAMVPNITDSGTSTAFIFNSQVFQIAPITAFNQTSAQVQTTLAPFMAVLSELAIPYSITYSDSTRYYDHYNKYMGPLPFGHLTVEAYQFSSRLIPRKVLETNNDALQKALRNITENGVLAVSVALNVTRQSSSPNAVLPAWRDAAIHMQMTLPWNNTPSAWPKMIADQYRLTNELVPQVEAVTPGSGVYMNEGDFRTVDWQSKWYGANYQNLLAVKNKWDPAGLFYGLKTVGSDAWTVGNDGRMCRA
ncbi:hypothetical protein DPSP01_002537 [Paraphaeosphaeria sporulosa]|uniref:FAD-binding domain-containing protein n=1 Tax=Paraphaeosphaeria sporulosa TaxID=1460663 RepID=A0A177CV43_9PLEO|nr:FAD-binding domain-containing protein [Paraphaeosphaeria sporulosa]OAG11425.1 FAD-binding domain-containing protein [Paraphaeosphaeria sporulosa]